MITKVIMPQVGQDIEIGKIVRWLKKAGDQVKKGDVLCEVETEKAVVEVLSR
jgi:pyruvate/2-oxoglutarate dehydrogenase complex dihydrolipoamide acyltransferase (E2) component